MGLSYLLTSVTLTRTDTSDTYVLRGLAGSSVIGIDEETSVRGDGSRRVTSRTCLLPLDTADAVDIATLRAWITAGVTVTASGTGTDVAIAWNEPVRLREVPVARTPKGPALARFEMFTALRNADVQPLILV